MRRYSVKQLSKLAGVSVRTLHLYDQLGLLKPTVRTEAGYRQYGENELLRLQQILFYRELDFPLKEIQVILASPDFEATAALESHREALLARRERISAMLDTVDQTIVKLKQGVMLNHEELYKGLGDKAEAYRQEAAGKWGEEAVVRSEKALLSLSKADFHKSKADMETIVMELTGRMHDNPENPDVQTLIARHYHIVRLFWSTSVADDKQLDVYAGLGDLYVSDERYTMADGVPNPAFAVFMQKAMRHFADSASK